MRLRDRIGLSIGAFRLSGSNRDLRLVQLARLASATGRWAYTIRLLRLDGETFAGTVTGNSASSDAAHTVIGDRLGLSPGLVSL